MNEKNMSKKQAAIQWLKDNNTYLILLVMIIVSAIISSNFLTGQNLGNLIKQNSIKGMLAIGMLLIIMTGDIDLSVGSIAGASNILLAVALVDWSMNAGISIFLAIAMSVAMGAVNGFFIVYRKLPAFIVTLAMMTIARGFAYLWSGGRPISVSDPVLVAIKQNELLGLPPYVWFFVIIFVIMFIVLRFVPYGRIIKAIGSNAQAVRLAGIRVKHLTMVLYVLTGILSAVAGLVMTGLTSTAMPSAGDGYNLDVITAVYLGGNSASGGEGSVWRTFMGILIIGILNNGMALLSVQSYWQTFVKGCLLIIAVIFDMLRRRG